MAPAAALRLLPLLLAPLASAGCATDLDCALNGKCTAGACVCAPAWRGPGCQTLALQPAPPTSDLRLPNVSTWGMGTVHTHGAWHGFFAEMEEGCGLTAWETNSLIAHAVAPSPNGPWKRVGETSGVWSHNPATAVAPDGTLLLFHIGSGSGGTALKGSREYSALCRDGTSPCGTHPTHHCNTTSDAAAPDAARTPGGDAEPQAPSINFFTAKDPAGPWKPFSAPYHGPPVGNNPAPWVHPNGTIYIVFNNGGMTMVRADDWRGPYTFVTHGACGGGEECAPFPPRSTALADGCAAQPFPLH